MSERKKQRHLQLVLAGGFILMVFLVGKLSLAPETIYVHSTKGMNGFEIGMTRDQVLRQINRVKSIRQISTCNPESRVALTSRKGFVLSSQMEAARTWQVLDRKKGAYVFGFEQQDLGWIVFLDDPEFDRKALPWLITCGYQEKEAFIKQITRQDRYPVQYD